MDAPPRFPPLDPSTYEWTPSSSPGQWRRPVLAGESLWTPRPKDYHEMFIGGTLALNALAPSAAVIVAAKAAWRRLLFEVPELVVSAAYGAAGNAYMQYLVPSSDEEVNRWVERTTSFQCGKRGLDFQELLENIRQKKEGHDSDQAYLLLRPVVQEKSNPVTHVDFILNADHQVTDGIGIRILLGRFLALLAEALSTPLDAQVELDWQQSVSNLTPPWTSLMNEEQLLSGPEYERVAEANEEVLFQKMPQNPGLPLISTAKLPIQKTHFITLTESQSLQLLRATKHVVSPESNITHLGHAAMALALLRSKSPSCHSQTLYSPCFLNGRRYLKPSLGQPDPTESYIPICQSFAPVVFSDLKSLALSKAASKDEIKNLLIKACKVATVEYGKIRERKSMLPECVVLFERLGENMHLKQQQDCSSQNEAIPNSPTTPPGELDGALDSSYRPHGVATTPSNGEQDSPCRTADPFFLSDGITEQYIDHEYLDKAKKRVFVANDITFAANAEKNLIVRMSSWRGRISISGEWNDCDYDGAMIARFLEDMVGIMLSLID